MIRLTETVTRPLWGVPRDIQLDDVHFVKRKSFDFARVYNLLERHRRVVLHGRSGIGKTELATQFVWEARGKNVYRGIFWMNATSKTTIQAGFHNIAIALKLLSEGEMRPPYLIQQKVLEVLDEEDGWLLVLDNLENAGMLDRALAQRVGTRHVLITARVGFSSNHTLKTFDQQMDDMDVNEGRQVLSVYLQRQITPEQEVGTRTGVSPTCNYPSGWFVE